MKSHSPSPLISIVIPTRDEAGDIAPTLESCLALDYEPKEIIVVDDSADETPKIISRFSERGVRLIHRDRNYNGCCGARNLGMQIAKGEILVLFNADDRPKPDFLNRILKHYQTGADYVIVRSSASNTEDIWGRFQMAVESQPGEWNDPEWCEGFSCRKAAAEAVGYLPGDFPLPFCRDSMLGKALKTAGFNKHIDLDIRVEHIVPATFTGFWCSRVWRGTFSAPHCYFFRKMAMPLIGIRESLKAILLILKYLTVLPALWSATQLAMHTPAGIKDFPSLFFANLINDVAMCAGNFKGFFQLKRVL